MDVITHKCPNCGGPLTFNPETQKFDCDFCLSKFTEEEVSDFEAKQVAAQMATEQDPTTIEATAATMDIFSCPSCGAEIVTEETTAATYCYYCHNPVVLTGRLSGEFLPDRLLPFAIEKEEAVERFLEWTKKKWFVPKAFFNKQQVEKLTGVYFPYWSVDAELRGQLQANGTKLRVWRVGDIEYTETKKFSILRKGTIRINDLVKNALSKNTQQKMVEGVQPFPLEKAISFKSQYLAGFQAEKRDIAFETIQTQVQQEIEQYSEDLLRESASGYTSLSHVQTNFDTNQQKNNYLLLPVWLVTYRHGGNNQKTYFYAMNGQTGKVSGILPVSYKRLGLTAGAIFILVLLLMMIGGYFI